jgi:cell division protein FtsN
MTIEHFIIDLLKHHNCVVVPNFGGFIANYQPAHIDAVSKTITPPSKQVMFNANLLNNDGLLANHIANKKAITYTESLLAIERKTKAWKNALKNDKRLVFGEIGFLYEQDGKIVFEQNRETNLWLKAFGLSSIQFIAAEETSIVKEVPKVKEQTVRPKTITEEAPIISLAENKKIETVEREQTEASVIPMSSEKKSRKKWGYLAAACALPFLFYTYWIPMETNFLETGNIQFSDFNPFRKGEAMASYETRLTNYSVDDQAEILETLESKIASIPDNVKVYNYQFDETLYIPVKLDTPYEGQAEAAPKSIKTAKDAKIQLIAGCFSIEANAISLVGELQNHGYPAYVLDKNKGLYRVAVNGFNDMAAAISAQTNLQSQSFPTWILRK